MSERVEGPLRSKQTGSRGHTAKLVAERAGVSVTTVSRVLNGRDHAITRETRERVLVVARELGYRPNSLAAALRRGVSNTIGLLIPDISDAYFYNVARGVQEIAHSSGYMMILCDTNREPERESRYVALLQDRQVDGIIFCGGGIFDEGHLSDLSESMVPVIMIGPHELPIPSVGTDDAGAIETLVDHLVGEGCRRILCLAGQPGWQVSAQRLEGYHRAVRKNGIDADLNLVAYGEFTEEVGYDTVRAKRSQGLEFDGVVTFNDYVAIGAMIALQEADVRIPGDVAVTGCDDIRVCSLMQPSLTSIAFPQYEFGRVAMQKILAMISGQSIDLTTTFRYCLKIRASSDRRESERGLHTSTSENS